MIYDNRDSAASENSHDFFSWPYVTLWTDIGVLGIMLQFGGILLALYQFRASEPFNTIEWVSLSFIGIAAYCVLYVLHHSPRNCGMCM